MTAWLDDINLVQFEASYREQLLKLLFVQDRQTGEQVFLGSIRIVVEEGRVIVSSEDTVFETPSGDRVDTRMLRVPRLYQEVSYDDS